MKAKIILLIFTALILFGCEEKPAHVIEFSDGSKKTYDKNGKMIEYIPAPKKEKE